MMDKKEKLEKKLKKLQKELEEKIASESELQEKLRWHTSLFKNIKTIIYFCDIQGKLLDMNPAGLRFLGYGKNELRNMDLTSTYVNPERRKVFLEQLKTKSYVSNFEFAVRNKNEKVKNVLETAILLKDKNNKPIGYCGIVQDITKKKSVENELTKSKEFHEDIVQLITEGVLVEDPNDIITFVNPGVEKMLGYSREELVGMHTSKITAPEHTEKTRKETKKRSRGISSRYEIELLAKDGHKIPIIVGVTPIIKNGKHEGNLAVFLDITEQKKLQKELMQKSQKLTMLSLTDWLTGLYNYRYFQILLEMEIKRSKRTKHSLSTIMIDIDNLKMVNDNFGHQKGDQVIIQIGQIINECLRATDSIARYGGDEFVCLLPETKQSAAIKIAQRLCKKVHRHFAPSMDFVSISSGVANYPLTSKSAEGLIFRADQAMYLAKSSGGNQARGIDTADIRDQEQWNLKTLEAFISVLSNREFQAGEELAKRLSERLKICFADKSINPIMIQMLTALGLAMDVKDHYPRGHSLGVRDMAVSVASGLGLSQEEIDAISLAAVLRDIGTIGAPGELLSSTEELSVEEQDIVRKHTSIGAQIMSSIKALDKAVPLVEYHHENWDGSGYPEGLKGARIPLGAQIISLVDVYYSLTTKRPYRKAFSRKKAIEIIQEEAGKKWKKSLADYFINNIAKKTTKIIIKKLKV